MRTTMRVICTALSTETGPHFELLHAAGFAADVPDRSRNLWDGATLIDVVRDYDAVIAGSEPYPPEVLRAIPRVRVLSRTGVGFDAIHLPTCDELGVVVATTPGVNHHAVAEHALAMLVALSRGFPARDQEVRRGAWARIPTRRLAGSTLGILGLGRIGQALATRARGLEMNVIAYDPYPPIEFARQWNVSLVSLEELWPRCDSISLHLPGGPATKHLINSATLAQMKRGAYLVNTARGSLIDEAALVDALRSGQLGGAGLDVFETEPLPTTSPLIDLPSVLLSGHVAGFDVESQFDTLTMSADTILQLYRGEWPADRIQNLKQLTGRWSW